MRLRVISSSLILLSALLLALPAEARPRPRHRGGWELLGERTVTDALDHDTIPVTAARGDFRRLQLRVEGRAVEFRDLKVHFGDGSTQDVELRRVIPAGGASRVIDLEGGDRVIRSVELWYDAQSLAGRRAVVRVYGRN